ncbi:hypothetical protein VPH35_130250 [Triticum aestivum]
MDPILRCPFPSIPSTPAAAVRGGDDAAAASARQGGLNPAAAELRETPDGVPWKAWIKEEHSDFVAAALRRGGRGSRRPMWVQWSRQQAHTTVVAHGAALVCDHMVAEEGRLPIALHAGRHLHRRLHQQDRLYNSDGSSSTW